MQRNKHRGVVSLSLNKFISGTVKTRIYDPRFLNFCLKKTTCIGGCGCDTALSTGFRVPCSTWLTCTHRQICCTAMDVLIEQYCGLTTLPVFWLVSVTFVSHAMYCIKLE